MAKVLGIGAPSKTGIVLESTYGTAIAIGSETDKITLTKESLDEGIEIIESEALMGSAGKEAPRIGNKKYQATLSTELGYTRKNSTEFCGIDLLFAIAMGGTPLVNETGAPAVNNYSYNLTDKPAKSFTLVFDKQVKRWQFAGCVVNGFTIAGESGKIVTVDWDIIAQSLIYSDTAIAALAARQNKRTVFEDGVLRLSAVAGGVPAAGDEIGVGNFSLKFNNNLSLDYSSPDGDATHTDATLIRQPERNGMREIEFECELIRYATGLLEEPNDFSTALPAWRAAGTPLHADYVFTLGTGATLKTFKTLMPHMLIKELGAPIEGAGCIKQKAVFTLFRGQDATGVLPFNDDDGIGGANTVITEELGIEMQNMEDGRTAAVWS